MTEASDSQLFAAMRDLWRDEDPMPPELDGEVLAILDAAMIVADVALLELVADDDRLVGVRGGAEGRTLQFSHGEFEVLVRLVGDTDGTRIDGWTVPGVSGTVRLSVGDRSYESTVDELGRFEFTGVISGQALLAFEPSAGSRGWATPEFTI